jgi:predicted nuclease of predicted toxin-antitoxin system
VISLLLDEPVSPSLASILADLQIDAIALRDRGRLQAADHEVWNLALAEDRTIVTMNGRHFRRLATMAPRHPGILVLPSGGSRDEQFGHVTTAIDWITEKFPMMPTFANYFIEVDESGQIVGAEIFASPLLAVRRRLSIH